MAFSFQPKVISDGMILYLDAANTRSYPGSGTTWTDLSSTGITGSLVNGPTFNTSNGGSIVFDGTNDRVDVENSNTLNPLGNFTIGCWVNLTSIPNTYLGIIDKYNGSFNYGYMLDIPNGGAGIVSSSFRFVNCVQSGYKEVIANTQFTTGSWNHLYGTYDGTNINIYVNGTLQGTASCSGTNVTESTSLKIGGDGASTNYMTGRITSVQIYNRALSATEVLQNYTALSGRFGKTPTITDYDALNFVNAALISNETQQIAINTLTTDLKNAGLWSKMKAIYPFVGGTAPSHKWNLKDPRDVDAAFRLTFSGGWTHSSNGALPNGTNGFSNTYFAPSSVSTLNSNSLGYYTGTNVSETTADPVNMGSYNSESQAYLVRKSNTSYSARMNGNIFSYNSNSMNGFIVASKQSSTVSVIYSNSISLVSGNSGGTLPTANIYIGNLNLSFAGAYPDGWVKNDFRFAFIGDGLTDADAANLYTIVQKYQTTLGRQV
jgi:hypothetical protein